MTDQGTPVGSRDASSLTLEYLLRRMSQKADFPALGASVTRVQALSEAENESLQSLCDEILKDVALTQKLLRVVNTVNYRRANAEPISTISRAVALIGVGNIRNLAISLVLVEHMEDKAHAQQLTEEFLRAVIAGTMASELCADPKEAEYAYIEALFRNLGRLLVAFYLFEDAQEIRALMGGRDGAAPLGEDLASQQVLGMKYEALGVAVGKEWSLPESLITHMSRPAGHIPNRSLAARPERRGWLATLANEAADTLLNSDPAMLGEALETLNSRYGVALDLPKHGVQEAAARARHRLAAVTQVLNLTPAPGTPAERLVDTYYVDAPNALPGDLHSITLAQQESWQLIEPFTEDGLPRPCDILTRGIQEMAELMVDTFELGQALSVVLKTIHEALACQRVVLCLRDAKSAMLVGRIGLGQGGDGLKGFFQIPTRALPGAPVDLFTGVALKGVDTLIADASTGSVAGKLPGWFLQRVQAPTFLLLPITMKRQGQDVLMGLIYADRDTADSLSVTTKDLSLLRTLRAQAVMAFKQCGSG
jgi:HD-like signal output (HDOD) protein